MRRLILPTAVRVLAAITFGIVVWEGIRQGLSVPDYLLPSPFEVFAALRTHHSYLWHHLLLTASEMGLGAMIGILGGVVAGISLATIRPLRWLCEPYLLALQAFPREALAPLFVVWLGLGLLPKVVLATLISFFPMALATLAAVSSTPQDYINILRSQGATELTILVFARIPNSIPGLLGGLRIALPLSLIGAVIGEFMGGSRGLGYVIATSGAQLRTPLLFSALFLLAVLGGISLGIVKAIEFALTKRFLNYLDKGEDE